MKRWLYELKLKDWERQGYNVSNLRDKWFPPKTNEDRVKQTKSHSRLLPILIIAVVIVSLSVWVIITVIPPEPVIMTFVVDTSTSMNGVKLENVEEGLVKALGSMNKKSQAGVIFFDDTIHDEIQVGTINDTLTEFNDVTNDIHAQGGAVLYGAIEAGIKMTDMVESNVDKKRAMVVLTDSQHSGSAEIVLHDLINMKSLAGYNIQRFEGFPGQTTGIDEIGGSVLKEEITGVSLAIETNYPVQIYFIGIGNEADLEIGRMLAEATDGLSRRVSENNITSIMKDLVK